MENASKALIIAGAILLAILLISLGIMIFGQAQDTVNNSGMSQAEMQAFNNKFLKYEGTRKGSEVKALINEVLASNADDNNAKRKVQVERKASTVGSVSYTAIAATFSPLTSDYITTKNYEIQLTYATKADESNTSYSTTAGTVRLISLTTK